MTRLSRNALLFLSALVPVAARAADAVSATPRAPDRPRVVQLTLRPAGEPDPALKYTLLPGPADQVPGNAAPLLYMAAHLAAQADCPDDLKEKARDFLDMPDSEIPREEVDRLFACYTSALRYARMAARREYCQWEMPIREEGFALELPNLSQYRLLTRLLALRARLRIAEGQFDEALEDLQTGYALARYVGAGPTLINNLVGAAISQYMSRQLERWAEAPGSPNLYWALANLPRPMIDSRQALENERELVYMNRPKLRELKTATLTPADCAKLRDEFLSIQAMVEQGLGQEPSWHDRVELAFTAAAIYPRAKEYVISLGRSPEQVEAMPTQQVIMIYALDVYEHWRDSMFKWFTLPFWQGREGACRAEEEFARVANDATKRSPLVALIPSLYRAYFLLTRPVRELNALQCIEAIRMHAEANGGQLPASLDEITLVPVPLDPVTGKPFVYGRDGQRAVIDLFVPERTPERDAVRYEITIAR